MKKILLNVALIAAVLCSALPTLRAADAPAPTVEQRIGALEAYMANTDPTAPLKDKDGKIPEGLTTAS